TGSRVRCGRPTRRRVSTSRVGCAPARTASTAWAWTSRRRSVASRSRASAASSGPKGSRGSWSRRRSCCRKASNLPEHTRESLRVDVTDVAPAGVRALAADVYTPAVMGDRPMVFCCVPGGGMSRGYFDLQPPPALGNYSMVRHLTDRGFVVVTLDPPAVGESDEPDDGYALTPDVVADVHARAFDELLARWPDATRIGVGHS